MFKKGHNIGRPKGSKDKSYLKLEFWYQELMKDWPKLRPSQRAKLSKELMQMLTNKMKSLPNSPEQSVINAKEAQELLIEIEGKKKDEGPKANSDEVKALPTLQPPEGEGR